MIPCLAMVRVGGHHRRTIRLWLPLFLLWPLCCRSPWCSPSPVWSWRAAYGVAAAGVLRTAWQLVNGWRGMHIEVDSPELAFQVRFI